MNGNTTDKLALIRQCLAARGLATAERVGGFRVGLDPQTEVDIYVLSGASDQVRARIKTAAGDRRERRKWAASTRDALSRHLEGTARVEPFQISREAGGEAIYNALVEVTTADLDAPIEISADAIEVIEDGPMTDPEAFQLDFGIDGDVRSTASLAERAMTQLESVDAKGLRRHLDMMGLKRSGVVRLALSRIFRSAADRKELEAVIRMEAIKIITPEDREELQTAKRLSSDGFLDPAVSLLWQAVFNPDGSVTS